MTSDSEQPNTDSFHRSVSTSSAPCGDEAVGDSAFSALFTAHTPSGPVHACADHAQRIVGLMAFLGAHVNLTAAPEGAQCSNCIKEAQRKAEQA